MAWSIISTAISWQEASDLMTLEAASLTAGEWGKQHRAITLDNPCDIINSIHKSRKSGKETT